MICNNSQKPLQKNEKKSVAGWLIVTNGPLAGKILLQQRAETKIEKGIQKPQSNPYVCQPTWNGKVKSDETLISALKREAEEELGSEFSTRFNFRSLVLFNVDIYSFRGEKSISYNFVGLISAEQLKLVELHSEALPDFIAIDSGSLPQIKDVSTLGADPKTQIVLFEDQAKTLKKLFFLKETLVCLE